MKYIMTDDPNEEDLGVILNNLRKYNLARIELNVVKPLAIFINDEDGNKLGGISAETHGHWLKILFFWIDETLRDQKIGTKLLKDAEVEAVKRGCLYSFVDTFGFQARGFYLKSGYKEVFTLEDYPLTGKRHYFVKHLTGDK